MNCQCRLSFFRPVLFDVSADAGRTAGIKKKRAFVFVCLCFVSISIWNNFTILHWESTYNLFNWISIKWLQKFRELSLIIAMNVPFSALELGRYVRINYVWLTVLAEWEVRWFSISTRKSWVWMPVIFSTCNWWILSIMTTENLFLLASTIPLYTYNKFPEFQGL